MDSWTMDGLSFDIDADMASVFVYLLGSDWKMRWELVVLARIS